MVLEHLYPRIIAPDRKLYHVPVFWMLRGVSFFYGIGHRLRLAAYRRGLFSAHRFPCRVISVGNLTLGGTGKSPLVMQIAELLRDHGHRPAILSRGYRGSTENPVNVVCDGSQVLLDPEVAGDEPVMMARRLGNVPVLVGPDRVRTGEYALKHFGATVLILDDGFQHLAVQRDLDILLLDADRPFGNGHLFPAGPLREPAAALRRADLLCLTRCRKAGSIPAAVRSLAASLPVVQTRFEPVSFARLDDGAWVPPDFLKARPVAGFCGIAQPADFRRTLEAVPLKVVWFQSFGDHHAYTAGDLRTVDQAAQHAGAQFLLTTEKDAVKTKLSGVKLPLVVVRLGVNLIEGQQTWWDALLGDQKAPRSETAPAG